MKAKTKRIDKFTLVIDTETISLNKPFVYDIGGVITDGNGEIVDTFSYCIEQVWHNKLLFSTAYYAIKRPIYVRALRGRKIKLTKLGNAMKSIQAIIDKYSIQEVYAYNSDFDKRALEFSCDNVSRKPIINAFDGLDFYDIRKIISPLFFTKEYETFCRNHERLTDTGRVSTTVETVVSFMQEKEYVENHTALADALDESNILNTYNYLNGTQDFVNLKPLEISTLKILDTKGKLHEFDYMTKRRVGDTLRLKGAK